MRPPGFPVEFNGVGEVPAAFLTESRTRGRVQRSVQEIRVPMNHRRYKIPILEKYDSHPEKKSC